jgi:hypothetical protein
MPRLTAIADRTLHGVGVEYIPRFTTPALMNGSSTAAIMNSVAVNSAGLFVAVGSNGSNYPVYSKST